MQVVDDGGHVGLKEHLVGAHRVTRQESLTLLGHEALDVGQDLLGRLFHRHGARLQVIEQPGGRVHVAHKVIHVVESLGGRRNEHVHAGVDNREVAVSDDDRHLDEGVAVDVQAGHFAVNPDQGVFQSFHAFYGSALWVIRLGGSHSRWPLLH